MARKPLNAYFFFIFSVSHTNPRIRKVKSLSYIMGMMMAVVVDIIFLCGRNQSYSDDNYNSLQQRHPRNQRLT